MDKKEFRRQRWKPSGAWNMLILFLSAYVLLAFLIGLIYPSESEFNKFLRYGDTAACIFFIADVFLRWMAAPNRLAYWKYAWIDLISSIPNFAPARWGRLFQVLRIIRSIRAIRATMRLSDYFFGDKIKSGYAILALTFISSVTICGMLVLQFESGIPNANIKSASDALWWAMNTVSTVGGGNVYPVSEGGRAVAMLLMIIGIGIFSTLAGIGGSWILRMQQIDARSLGPSGKSAHRIRSSPGKNIRKS